MNILDIGLAFLEGIALIVSPCILPVLPLVLVGSVSGGKRRPYGIIIGFVVAFSLFALAARKLVALLGLDLDVIKNVSLVLLGLFGLILLSPWLTRKFSALTQGLADFGNRLAGFGGEGLLGGVLIGALIGLVWTPCAGPILAAVLVQVIRQKTDLAGDLTILSFAIGAGVPMLVIALMGRRIMDKLGFFARHAEAVRMAFGLIILMSVAYLASGVTIEALFMKTKPSQQAPAQGELVLQEGLRSPYRAPEFSGIETWLNSPPLSMMGLHGKVVLVDFWTYSCVNCVRTFPYLTDWDKRYRDLGLVIVGVHSPEFEFEKKVDNVKAAIAQYGIKYPVALDNNLDTWSNFANRYWPAHYLIDRDGKVVYTHFGEGEYDVTENNIRYLLGLKGLGEPIVAEAPTFALGQTPETYLGYARANSYGGRERIVQDAERGYSFPLFLPSDEWALSGKWRVEREKIVATEKGAALRLNFKARRVFLVLGTAIGKTLHASIRLNGEAVNGNAGKDAPDGRAVVGRNTLYELIDQKTPKNSLIEIKTDEPGLEAYAFTFG